MADALHQFRGRGLRRITTQAGRRRTHGSASSLPLNLCAQRRFRVAHSSTPTEPRGLVTGRTAMAHPTLAASGVLSGLATQIQLDILAGGRLAYLGDGQ